MRQNKYFLLPLAILLTAVLAGVEGRSAGARATSTAGRAPAAIEFNRDIRPILADNCFSCHGPDKGKRKAGLRLDRAPEALAALESGDRAIVPGDPSKSQLLRVITTADEEDRMPPKKTGKKLTPEQVTLLRSWIQQGAPYSEHWAYVPPVEPPLPPVKDNSWARNEIDRFILAGLEREKLSPSPEADRRTLIRRVTLDLTGLPPTIAEVDAFLADRSPKAYEKVVDRLLGSQAYGERMAQQWLDLARYADSDGYHSDNPRSMWQYRDYVIKAFNENKPFDQFTVEQLAGDLLPSPTLEQRIATAFNRNGMSSTEGGADPDEYLNKYVTDRVNTFGTVFLGSSIACTECHDHKYDPFTQREYYQLYDFFNRIPEKGLDSDPAPPFVKVPTAEQAASQVRLTNELQTLEANRKQLLAKADPDLDRQQASWEQEQRTRLGSGWSTLDTEQASGGAGTQLKRLEDGSYLASGSHPEAETYALTSKPLTEVVRALRLEALLHESLPLGGSARSTNASFLLSRIELEAVSADPSREPGVDDGVTWGTWSMIGPFRAGSFKEVFDKAFISEPEVDLAKSYDDGKLRWVEKTDWKQESPLPLSGENQATYFHRTVRVTKGRYFRLALGSDGGAQIWLNGTKYQGGKIFRKVAPAPEDLLIYLPAGENKLLVKVHHGSGEYGFLFAPAKQPVTHHPVELATAFTDHVQKGSDVKGTLDDKPETGWAVDGQDEKQRRSRTAIFLTRQPVEFAGGTLLKVKLHFPTNSMSIGRLRLSRGAHQDLEPVSNLPQGILTALFGEGAALSEPAKTELKEYYRDHFQPELKTLNGKLAETRKSARELYDRIPNIRVMEDMPEPRVSQIRVRGDYRNKGETVVAGVPHVLTPLPATERTNRMTLARWLTDPSHPLLSRVTVNRYWALYFGAGLVKTGNEFGTQGEMPSHPELLDWLARHFIKTGWDVKGMQKTIVTSATYRQSSKPTPELLARDPLNRWYARGPRMRLSAEVIRDCALDYAGLLDRKRPPGGPSVKPYQPAGLWEEKMFGGNKYEESTGADLYRRSLYTLWKRTVLNPTLMTFDAPDRAICTEQRSVTCTPLQALVTLNEKGFVEAARVLAQRTMVEGGSSQDQRVQFMFKTVLARPPSPREKRILTGIHTEMKATYTRDLKAAADLLSTGSAPKQENLNEVELVAWTAVANMVLNLDETVTKE